MGSERLWKLSVAKLAPRRGARAISKSKSLKTDGFGSFLEVQTLFCVAGAGILARCEIRGRRKCSVMSMFEADDAESVEGLQISRHGSVTLQGSFRMAVTGVRIPRLNFFVAGAVLLKYPLKHR